MPLNVISCSSAKFSGHVSHPRFTFLATMCLLALLTDVPGGRIRVARIRLIVGLITPYRIYLTIMKPIREAKARSRALVPLKKKKKKYIQTAPVIDI
jgi:hypothetical protein